MWSVEIGIRPEWARDMDGQRHGDTSRSHIYKLGHGEGYIPPALEMEEWDFWCDKDAI